MEILAPAGSPDSLVAAIAGGADAVYLGGKQFGARKFSENFDDSQMEGAISYAHDRGVKIYVTVNTLVRDPEMMDVVSYIRFLKNIGADAVIIQDIGLLNAISKVDINKHASTQMGIHSPAGLQWCSENGISRAILARELTLEEMHGVITDSPVEVEVFVQGALCYCMSGGCLFSSMAGGRSGNRGECAQPCRKRYTSENRSGYLMNTKDLFCIDKMDTLRKMGITSVKIEGRMRSPVHSYLTSRLYSLTEKGPSDEIESTAALLRTIFNRGYGTGYMDGINDLVQTLYPDNRGLFLGTVEIKKGRFSPDGMDINHKDGISIFVGEEKIGGFKVTDAAISVPFKIRDGTYEIYRTYDPRIDLVKNTFPETPIFSGKTKRPPSARLTSGTEREKRPRCLSVYVSSLKVLDAVKHSADLIYFEHGPSLNEASEICASAGISMVTVLPRFDSTDIRADGPVMVHNVGQMLANKGNEIYASHHMNLFNSFIPDGLLQVTLSAELSKNDISRILRIYPGRTEVMVFGRTELMITRDPDMGSCTLTDEKGFEFPVYRDRNGWAHILNSSDLFLLDHLEEMETMGVDSFGIDLRMRPAGFAKKVMHALRHKNSVPELRELCSSVTYGHYLKGLS